METVFLLWNCSFSCQPRDRIGALRIHHYPLYSFSDANSPCEFPFPFSSERLLGETPRVKLFASEAEFIRGVFFFDIVRCLMTLCFFIHILRSYILRLAFSLGGRVAEFICTISCLLMHQIPHSGLFSDESSPGEGKAKVTF